MTRLSQKSDTFDHSEVGFSILVIDHIPPLTPAAQTFPFESKFPSSIKALVLPACLLGPRSVQFISLCLLK